ncbi:hypothetical protein, partial [Pseudomonas corrugata]|uniref:hypothetical protein n=1 Tax=Pseudomonas corrugata TaxID=47879 RepID=UPI0019D6E3D5
MNACLTAAGALRPTGKPNQSDWDSNQGYFEHLPPPGPVVIRSLKIPEPGILAQMNGHRRARIATCGSKAC